MATKPKRTLRPSQFLGQMSPQTFPLLFQCLEKVIFFIKDRSGRFVMIHRGPGMRGALGLDTGVLSTDYDWYPRCIADRIRADDLRVMQTGEPRLNVVEFLINPARCAVGWHITHKFPVRDRRGKIIGVMGTVQPCDGRFQTFLSDGKTAAVIERALRAPGAIHTVAAMARATGMSPKRLGRQFHRVTGIAPREFLMLCRIKHACEQLLAPAKTVATIAQEAGFCDQSAFAYQFRKVVGIAPLEYRRHAVEATRAARRFDRSRGMSQRCRSVSEPF